MRTLAIIEKELAEAREALTHVQGKAAEVYSRIVGYYRSVRNWNKGKFEEYGERKLFQPQVKEMAAPKTALLEAQEASGAEQGTRLILFVRPACPACPAAKDAAKGLDIPVELIDTDTDEGLAEAQKRQVMATPTAILLDKEGRELRRLRDAASIAELAV